MVKRFTLALFLISLVFVWNKADAGLPPIFEIVVTSSVSDTWDYQYTLTYDSYDPDLYQMRGISHWWLEINCAHSYIDEPSIYGYSMIGGTRYDWPMTFDDKVGQTGDYTDWVIKWDKPDGIEMPLTTDINNPFAIFGFHSTQPPTTGNWGAKDGNEHIPGDGTITLSDSGTTQIPRRGNCIPEPTSLSLLGLGLLGLLGLGRKK